MYIFYGKSEYKGDFPMLKTNKKLIALLLISLVLCALGFQMPAPAEWQKPLQPSLSGGTLTCMALHPQDASKFLVASECQIFEGRGESSWQSLWSQSDARTPIRRLFSFPDLPETVFALTDDKLFMGNLKDLSWRKVYQDSNKKFLSFAVHPNNPNRWFLGTQKGLWETRDAGRSWSRSSLFTASKSVTLLFFDHDRLFLADERSLYLAIKDNPARSVFELSRTSAELPAPEDDAAEILEEPILYSLKVHDLIETRSDPRTFFLATQNGVFQSMDLGHRWDPLSRSGLQSTIILQLAYSEKEKRLYAATPRGIYGYDPRAHRWTDLFEGLAKTRAQSIAVLNEEKLLAITAEGFAQYPLENFRPEAGPSMQLYQPPEETLMLFKKLISMEPTAREVQKRVIRYANVSNGKIQRWHLGSRLAGTLPTFSFGRNLDRNASISSYSGKFITGPQDVSKGWDANVSWHLGDMIYSSDQTSIDSREKMMVELRNDLLSEATRIYYERRRLQIDLIFTPPASEQEHLENLLRLDELTSLLDGMTEGFYSKQLEKLYDAKPEFNKLWSYASGNG